MERNFKKIEVKREERERTFRERENSSIMSGNT